MAPRSLRLGDPRRNRLGNLSEHSPNLVLIDSSTGPVDTTLAANERVKRMAKKTLAIDLNARLREEADKSYTIVVEISGIPSVEAANRVSNWLRQAIRESADMLGELDRPPTRQ